MTQTTVEFKDVALRRILDDLYDSGFEDVALLRILDDLYDEWAPVPAGDVHVGHILLDITGAFRQLDPAQHESLWFDIMSAAVAGGLSRRIVAMSDCMVEQVD